MSETFARVAELVLHTGVDDMTPSVQETAALLFLDTLGVLIGAVPIEAGVIARDTAALLYASTDPGFAARMLFDGRPVSLAGAAYATATQTDNLDAHDGYNPTKGHIGVAIVPSLAALAEQLPDLTGPEALAAMIIGYEIAGRAGLALHASVSDYHTSGAWNALGVAAMAARLRVQSADQLRQALGIAEYHGPRSQMMREIANPTMLHDGSGWGAMVGLSASVLAERGFTGAPAITLEHTDVAGFWSELGADWLIEDQYIKPYPICRWAHAAIDGVRLLMRQHDLSHDQIKELRVFSFHEAACLFPGMPQTTSQAQYSLPFALAAHAVHGRIGVEHISGAGLTDTSVAKLIERITVSERDRHNARFPMGRWADVELTMNDGQIYRSGDINARGGAEDPLSPDDIIAKFNQFAIPVLGEARTKQICTAVLSLPSKQAWFSDLARLIYDPPGT